MCVCVVCVIKCDDSVCVCVAVVCERNSQKGRKEREQREGLRDNRVVLSIGHLKYIYTYVMVGPVSVMGSRGAFEEGQREQREIWWS